MIRKFYTPDDPPGADPAATATVAGAGTSAATPDATGGGGGGATPPAAPKGYTATTPQQRTDWNGFLDYASKQGTDLTQAKNQTAALAAYKKANPNFSVTADQIPNIQYEADQIRNGNQLGNLGPMAMNYLRQGLSSDFLGRTKDEVGNLRYPVSDSHGTDLEGYYNSKVGLAPTSTPPGEITASAPGKTPAIAAAGPAGAPSPGTAAAGAAPASGPKANVIPRPDYTDQAARNKYLQQWAKQYGDLQGRGDTIMKLNEVPRGGKSTEEQIATNAAKKYGIDPALLHVSAFEEGASELFKDKSGLDTKHRKPTDFGYMGNYGDKDFPINGNNSFGMPDFAKRFPDLVSGGYLPKTFQSQFRGLKNAGEFSENNFKSPEDAMQAKAALMKYGADYVDKQAEKNGVQLTPKQKDFFTLAFFNGGEGAVLSRIPLYKKQGYLKDDSFLDHKPKEEMGKQDFQDVYAHIVPRIKRRDALLEQGYFQNNNQ